jgi:amino acid transporter
VKILGIAAFAAVGLWVSGLSFETVASGSDPDSGAIGFLAAVALSILAYKGFTTITNSGDEITEPKKNVGRSIVISLGICTLIYLLVTLAVAGNLSVEEIIAARDSSLAEAARPAVGPWGEWLTIALAIVATVSGVIASMFAVSRMLAMLTEMDLVPHRHFGMPGRVQKHTLVYTAVIATVLTVFFDLGRIASLGAFFYIVMDMAIHWGVYRHLRKEVGANGTILLIAIGLDAIVLGAFGVMKANSDPLVLSIAIVGIALIFLAEWLFLRAKDSNDA